ncbi:MAG: aldose epimerase family protein [Longicatena sp.]
MEYEILKYQYANKDIDVIVMQNMHIKVVVSSLGCTIISIFTNDKYGNNDDVILGFDELDTYLQQDKYIGAIVGRCAGRIKNATFTLNEKEYHLAKNNAGNTLHGGNVGFNQKIFTYAMLEDGIDFHYLSKDGEENFPGNLDVHIKYRLVDNTLIAEYVATTDADTIVNLTNHMYFNLQGKGSVLDHELMIDASNIICSDADGCANGVLQDVSNTPFDFRKSKRVGKDIDEENEQLAIGSGYDHYYVFDRSERAVVLKDPISGRVMEVSTNQKGCQLYTANFLDGKLKGKKNWYFKAREALCIETQAAPNAIHTEVEPSTILLKGNTYQATTVYEFKIEGGEVD